MTTPELPITPPTRGRRLGLGGNAAANAASKLFNIAVALALAPFIIHELGLRTFGFWALISAFTQYANLLDLGVGAALTRTIAEYEALEDYDGITRTAAAALVVALAMSAIVVAIAVLACVMMPSSWSDGWPGGWELATISVTGALACVLTASCFQAFPRGLGRWDLQAVPALVYQVVFSLGAVILLAAGGGVGALGLSSLAAGLCTIIVAWRVQRRVWSRSWALRTARRDDMRELVSYGVNLQAGAFTTIVNSQADKPMILAVGGSLEFVGLYELASRVAFQLRALPVSALGPLTAKFAAETAGRDADHVRGIYQRSSRGVSYLGVGPLMALYGVCFPLTLAWLGTDYRESAWMVLILGFGYGFNLLTGAGSALANGRGRPQLERNYCFLCLAINLSLSAILGTAFGGWGVVAATCIGLVVASAWFLWRVDVWLADGSDWTGQLLEVWARPTIAGLAIAAVVVAGANILPLDDRLPNLVYGGFAGLAVLGVWWAAMPEARSFLQRRRGADATASGPPTPTASGVA